MQPTPGDRQALADLLEAEWSAARPGEPVVRRHLGTDPLLAEDWMLATIAGFTPGGDRTQAHRDALALAAELAAELTDADAVLLAVPLYNFGVSQHFKPGSTWSSPEPDRPPRPTGKAVTGGPEIVASKRIRQNGGRTFAAHRPAREPGQAER
jgi:hypothetical protein